MKGLILGATLALCGHMAIGPAFAQEGLLSRAQSKAYHACLYDAWVQDWCKRVLAGTYPMRHCQRGLPVSAGGTSVSPSSFAGIQRRGCCRRRGDWAVPPPRRGIFLWRRRRGPCRRVSRS